MVLVFYVFAQIAFLQFYLLNVQWPDLILPVMLDRFFTLLLNGHQKLISMRNRWYFRRRTSRVSSDEVQLHSFKELELETIWANYLYVYPLIATRALQILAVFGSTYLCEAAFSGLIAIKTKYRNRLRVERDFCCSFSGVKPRIKNLVAKKQCQVYHWCRKYRQKCIFLAWYLFKI